MAGRLDDVMVEVLVKLNSVTEHLRQHNFTDSANKIAKSSQDIINTFSDVAIKFPDNEFVLFSPREEKAGNRRESIESESGGSTRTKESNNGSHTTVEAPVQTGSTWAKVAAAPELTGGNAIIKLKPIARQVHQNATAVPTGHGEVREPDEEIAAVVYVDGNFPQNAINFCTSKICEGPLYSIHVSEGMGYAEITFLYAAHAIALVESDKEEVEKKGYGRFGPGFNILCTETLDWNRMHRKMTLPSKERRRLTFARSGLLGAHLSFKKFETDIAKLAGDGGVEFIWPFNSGNVTAIFKSVAVARTVRAGFLRKAALPGAYRGVQVTFSTDPCEKQLSLGTQMATSLMQAGCSPQNLQPSQLRKWW